MIRTAIVRALALLSFATAPLLAQETGEGERPAPQAPPSVRSEMEKVEAALEVVAAYVQTFEGEAPLAQLDAALKALQESKQHAPRSAARQPEDQRAEFLRGYRRAVNASIRALLDLEDAILAADKDATKAAWQKVDAAQKSGHETYKRRRRR